MSKDINKKENHMPQPKSHKNCKFFGYHDCPHKNKKIMKRAIQYVPEYYGGNYPTLSFHQDEEIDAICSKCDKFTQK